MYMGAKFKAFLWAHSSTAHLNLFCSLVSECTFDVTWIQLPNLLVTVPGARIVAVSTLHRTLDIPSLRARGSKYFRHFFCLKV
jgi:hypothetical protein